MSTLRAVIAGGYVNLVLPEGTSAEGIVSDLQSGGNNTWLASRAWLETDEGNFINREAIQWLSLVADEAEGKATA